MQLKVCAVLVVTCVLFINWANCASFTCVGDPVCVRQGGNCSGDNSQCEFGTHCSYNFTSDAHTCVNQVGLGAKCESNSDCLNDEYTFCWEETCQSLTWDQKVGETCNFLHNCRNELYCNATGFTDGVCLQGVGKGQNCSDDIQCGTGLACNADNTCVEYFSVAEGAACYPHSTTHFPSLICGAGLYCKWNDTTFTSTCAKGFASSNKPCNSSSPLCDNTEESCTCNDDGQSVCLAPLTITASQQSAFKKLDSCIANTNCNENDFSKCCAKERCDVDFLTVAKSTRERRQKILSSCGYSDPYKTCESFWKRSNTGVKVGIIVGIVAGVLVVAGLAIFLVKRNSGYSRIN